METHRLLLYKMRTRPFYIIVTRIQRAKKNSEAPFLSLWNGVPDPVILLIRKLPIFMECRARFGFILTGSLATDSKILCADKSVILTFYVNLRPLLDLSIT